MNRKPLLALLAVAGLAALAFLFFFPDDVEGNVLQQHDIQQGIANGEEGRAFHEATGETTRWTDSLFGGMPNFQISPSYPAGAMLNWVWKVYTLWLPSPANLLFAMMLGFFIMCLCMRMKWPLALFGALAWGFSTYFIIIIGAGHIWKFVTLAYIPPTIGGLALAYRGRYLPGGALAALFGALQLQSNHPQMSYYFGFVILAMVIAWFVSAIRKKRVKRWCWATLTAAFAGALALAANAPSLYNSYEYAKETVRGRATELTQPGDKPQEGMSRSAITAWSYGTGETFSLLIPNVKGGATIKPVAARNELKSMAESSVVQDMAETGKISAQELNLMSQFPQYFGDQPLTNGPVYVGAFILVLAVLALFVVPGPMKWMLFAVSVLAILLSWGQNFQGFTDFFIDYVPGYNKFRAVSSILVIVEFTVPLLAVMAIKKILDTPDFFRRNGVVFYTVFGLGAFVCFLAWVAPSMFGPAFSAAEQDQLRQLGIWTAPEYQNFIHALADGRHALVSRDGLRSLVFILLGGGVMLMYFKGILSNKTVFVCSLCAVAVIDLFPLNKRYVDGDNFVAPLEAETTFQPTEADKAILKDTTHYRVLDVADFNGARSSYFHKTLGGYHAAKLTRYNDLLDHQIRKGTPGVINMLNAKYVLNGNEYELNPEAYGAAWLVDSVIYVADANEEMAALDTLDTRRVAVADEAFRKQLGEAPALAPGDTIALASYAPNRLTYNYTARNGAVAAFSEVWFPWGWEATVDGKPSEIGRVDYVLRALRLPAGSHKVEFRFDPKSVRVTNTISYVAVTVIYVLVIAAITGVAIALSRRRKKSADS